MPIRKTEESSSLLLYLFLKNQITEKDFIESHYNDDPTLQLQRISVIKDIIFETSKYPLKFEDSYYHEIQHITPTNEQQTVLQSLVEKYASRCLLEIGESLAALERDSL